MIGSTQLQPPVRERYTPTRYVYVKMLTGQADAQEGKLVKGQILVVPEDKASRWVYRSRIARPASKEEYDKYQRRMSAASRTGQGVRRRPVRGMSIPDENPFEYVVPESHEWDDADAEEDAPSDQVALTDEPEEVRLTGANTLSDRLGAVNVNAAEADVNLSEGEGEDGDEDDGDDEREAYSGYTYPGDEKSEPVPQPGHYDDVITRPGADAESPKPEDGRPRARARGSR
jgi:hypothetical protein